MTTKGCVQEMIDERSVPEVGLTSGLFYIFIKKYIQHKVQIFNSDRSG